jgi:hypothetical protein
MSSTLAAHHGLLSSAVIPLLQTLLSIPPSLLGHSQKLCRCTQNSTSSPRSSSTWNWTVGWYNHLFTAQSHSHLLFFCYLVSATEILQHLLTSNQENLSAMPHQGSTTHVCMYTHTYAYMCAHMYYTYKASRCILPHSSYDSHNNQCMYNWANHLCSSKEESKRWQKMPNHA